MNKASTFFLQIVVVLVGVGALAFLIWEPRVEGVNAHATNWEMYSDPFILLVYAGSLPFFFGLYQVFLLLKHIRHDSIFSSASARALRAIKFCAVAIIGFVILEEIFILLNHGDDDAAGAVAIGLAIIFCSIAVAVTAGMFERLLQRVVARTPNSLSS